MLLLSQVYRDLSIEIILWLLGAFLLGYILRYFIGAKWKTMALQLEKDLAAMTAKANNLEAELSTARYEKEKIAGELNKSKKENADIYFKLKACEESLQAATGQTEGTYSAVENIRSAPLGFAAPFIEVSDPKLNDLKLVEGIGPKIEEVLKDEGIANLAVLAEVSAEAIKAILDKHGEKYRLADPATWPEQAKLAVEGKWDRLQEYQDFLKGGKT